MSDWWIGSGIIFGFRVHTIKLCSQSDKHLTLKSLKCLISKVLIGENSYYLSVEYSRISSYYELRIQNKYCTYSNSYQ